MKKLILSLCLLLLPTLSVAGNPGYSVDYIRGEGDVEGIKLAARYNAGALSYISDDILLYWEASVNFWEYGAEDNHDTDFVLAVSPVLVKQIGTIKQAPLFLEAGIGLSLIEDTTFADKDVSTHYQFEDRLGLMMQFGNNNQHHVAVRYFHYSNAGFKKPNPGLDFIALSYQREF